jgi:hypothetical protein
MGECVTWIGEIKIVQMLIRKLYTRPCKIRDLYGRIILNWIIKKWNLGGWTGFIWPSRVCRRVAPSATLVYKYWTKYCSPLRIVTCWRFYSYCNRSFFFRESFPDNLSSSDWVVSCSLNYNGIHVLGLCYAWRIARKCNDFLLHVFFSVSYYWIHFSFFSLLRISTMHERTIKIEELC